MSVEATAVFENERRRRTELLRRLGIMRGATAPATKVRFGAI
jgi:hypothetical protein